MPDNAAILIHVVDDEFIFADVVAAILRSEGYRTEAFDNPAEVVAALGRPGARRPAVLMTDFLMPTMNGMELIIKARTLVAGIKTILFSGQVEGEVLGRYAVKPDRFLGKPFQPRVLLDTIAEVLNQQRAPDAPAAD